MTLYSSSAVDITYNRQVSAGDEVYTEVMQNAASLASHYENRILKTLPAEILKRTAITKIRIRFEDGLPTDGLFIPPDESWQNRSGSENGIVQLRLKSDFLRDERRNVILAHEFFHLVHFLLHRGEPAWMREGMAQVFEWMANSSNEAIQVNAANVQAGLKKISTRLDAEFDVQNSSRDLYGHVYLYFYYLYKRCGKQDLFWALAQGDATSNQSGLQNGFQTIDSVLKKNKTKLKGCESAIDSIREFEIARAHNRKMSQSDEYFLLNSTWRADVLAPSKDVLAVFESLKPNQPLLLSQDQFQKLPGAQITARGFQVRFLESKFPYAVSEQKPASSSYRVLVIKPQMP